MREIKAELPDSWLSTVSSALQKIWQRIYLKIIYLLLLGSLVWFVYQTKIGKRTANLADAGIPANIYKLKWKVTVFRDADVCKHKECRLWAH